ncbi:unnamed protein product [Orchesella dallaii]|uniref:Uncharacterized protein n=1 Tax=Orchesella dallaii TaxID=48710 RepID=A0ABP1S7W2_9HEXA
MRAKILSSFKIGFSALIKWLKRFPSRHEFKRRQKVTEFTSINAIDKWLAKWVEISYLTFSLPIRYNPSNQLYYVTPSTWRRAIWYMRAIILAFDCIYLILVSPNVTLESVGDKESSDFWVHTISRICGCFITWLLSISMESSVQLLNILSVTCRNWKGNYGRWGDKFHGPSELHLRRFLQVGAVFLPIQPAFPLLALYLQNRKSYRYWPAHAVPKEIYNSIVGVVGTGIYDIFLSQIITNPGFSIVVPVVYFVLMRFFTVKIM